MARTLNDDQLWAAIDAQRLRTAQLLDELSDEQWRHPSLCEGWTVRDVAAHLTLQQVGPGAAVLMLLKHPGGVNRLIREAARDRAALPTEELIARLRASVGSRRHNLGLTGREILIDILVHSQDIAVPLGLPLEIPPEAAAEAATRMWSSGGMKARVFRDIPLGRFRLVADDIDWAVGAGPEIRGPISALLLLLTGRPAALPRLTGPGADTLRRQLATIP